jgi:UDP-N-acetylmuramoyl-tripeptide--D-alanyl-D-alanine ligase
MSGMSGISGANGTNGTNAVMMTLGLAHALLPGSSLVGDPSLSIARVASDTRTLQRGDLYVALKGERFDGHDFLVQAKAAGAVAALAERGLGAGGDRLPGLIVSDALAALQQLAAAWRARFTLPLVAVTGSNGKTTVTQMLASMLRAAYGDAALATQGNFNNHIGVPLTLLRLRESHRGAALELGTNHVGEIALLAALAKPTAALINNAQREHQEFLPGLEAVARENGSVIAGVPADGTVILPAADAYMPLWRELAGARRVLTFGLAAAAGETPPGSDVTVSGTWDTAAGAWQLRIALPTDAVAGLLRQPGRHNLLNAAAAAACAHAIGIEPRFITAGLERFEPVAGRSRVLQLRREGQALTLVDDAYNANPDSVRAAIDVLAELPGPRWLILGDMAEVGQQGPAFHAEVGAYARERGIEHVWSAGDLCTGLGLGRHFADAPAVRAALAEAPPARAVLVKGSRFMKMPQIVLALQELWGEAKAHAA